jgi:hypothetical protein
MTQPQVSVRNPRSRTRLIAVPSSTPEAKQTTYRRVNCGRADAARKSQRSRRLNRTNSERTCPPMMRPAGHPEWTDINGWIVFKELDALCHRPDTSGPLAGDHRCASRRVVALSGECQRYSRGASLRGAWTRQRPRGRALQAAGRRCVRISGGVETRGSLTFVAHVGGRDVARPALRAPFAETRAERAAMARPRCRSLSAGREDPQDHAGIKASGLRGSLRIRSSR